MLGYRRVITIDPARPNTLQASPTNSPVVTHVPALRRRKEHLPALTAEERASIVSIVDYPLTITDPINPISDPINPSVIPSNLDRRSLIASTSDNHHLIPSQSIFRPNSESLAARNQGVTRHALLIDPKKVDRFINREQGKQEQIKEYKQRTASPDSQIRSPQSPDSHPQEETSTTSSSTVAPKGILVSSYTPKKHIRVTFANTPVISREQSSGSHTTTTSNVLPTPTEVPAHSRTQRLKEATLLNPRPRTPSLSVPIPESLVQLIQARRIGTSGSVFVESKELQPEPTPSTTKQNTTGGLSTETSQPLHQEPVNQRSQNFPPISSPTPLLARIPQLPKKKCRTKKPKERSSMPSSSDRLSQTPVILMEIEPSSTSGGTTCACGCLGTTTSMIQQK